MNRGFIKLWRKSLDAGWIKNQKLWAFWTYCLMKANHRENFKAIVRHQEILLQPGQFVFGRRVAARETGLTEREIRTVLAFLASVENVTIRTTNRFSIITVVNWRIYQGSDSENDPQKDQRSTSKRPRTRIKEHKKNIYSQDAFEVLAYLNEKTGKKFSNTDFIQARLSNGGTVEDCKRIIDTKIKDPFFMNDNYKFMRPSTLFSVKHFDEYLNEAISKQGTQTFGRAF